MGLILATGRNHGTYPIPSPTLPLKGRELVLALAEE